MKICVYCTALFSMLLLNVAGLADVQAFGVEGKASSAAVVVAETAAEEGEPSESPSSQENTESMAEQFIGNPDSIEKGRELFGNTCLFCHGMAGKGARAPTLTARAFAPGGGNDNEYFINTIKNGRPGTIMGAFEGTLTETEMWQIISYLRDQARINAEQK